MKTFVIADTHFGHKNVITFKDSNDEIIRKFGSIEEHDNHIKSCWNSVVTPGDTVYHLGDVVINRKALPILNELNGRKVLVKGNHDIFKIKDYLEYFDDVRAYKVLPEHRIILSHIPIHRHCLDRWNLNIHGHLHHNIVKKELILLGQGIIEQTLVPDEKYMCVSVDQTNYYPLDLQQLIKPYLNKGGEDYVG